MSEVSPVRRAAETVKKAMVCREWSKASYSYMATKVSQSFTREGSETRKKQPKERLEIEWKTLKWETRVDWVNKKKRKSKTRLTKLIWRPCPACSLLIETNSDWNTFHSFIHL